jgi:hypothetical protein
VIIIGRTLCWYTTHVLHSCTIYYWMYLVLAECVTLLEYVTPDTLKCVRYLAGHTRTLLKRSTIS